MLLVLHDGLGNAATLFTLVLGLWGLLRYFRKEGVNGSYLGAVVVAEVLIIVQGLMGGLLLGAGARPAETSTHLLYGATALITFPAFYAYVRGRDSRREMLLWALIALFVFGVTIRARIVA